MLTLSGFSEVVIGVTTCPDVLNSLSNAQLVVHTQKIFIASLANVGYNFSCSFHHFNGVVSLSMSRLGDPKYASISFTTLISGDKSLDSSSTLFRNVHNFLFFAGGDSGVVD